MSLKIADASQIDVVNDLLMLKSHSGDKNALRSQPTAYTQSNNDTAGKPYQATLVRGFFFGTGGCFQTITSIEAHKKQSFE